MYSQEDPLLLNTVYCPTIISANALKYGEKVLLLQYEILCNHVEDCVTVVIITIDDSC